MLLHNTLHLKIYGRYYRIPIVRLFHRPRKGRIFVQIPIFSSVRSIQDRIIRRLYPVAPKIAVHRESDDVAGKCIIRISPDIIILQPYPLNIRIILFVSVDLIELLRRLIIYPFHKNTVSAGRALIYNCPDLLFFNPKTFLQYSDGRLYIILVTEHYLHVKDHIIHPLACRNLRSVAVYDIAPLERYDPAVILLLVKDHLRIAGTVGSIDIRDPQH